MVGELIYIVMETTSTDSTAMSVHITKQGADAKAEKLRSSWPDSTCRYWVDILRVKA
jgi:hypothetical protein